jgi:hypothetical protein
LANLNDPDVEAFFRQGDEGTYSGGPGDSIPAGVVNSFDDLDEDTLPRVTREQVERRDRYKRRVTGLVSALGVAAVLAFVVRAVADRHDDVVTVTPAAAPQPAAVVAETPPVTALEQQPASNAAEAPSQHDAPSALLAVADRPREEAPAEAAPTPSEEGPRAPAKRTGETAPMREARAPEKRAERPFRNSEAKTILPAPTSPMAPAGFVRSSPPTANFPD